MATAVVGAGGIGALVPAALHTLGLAAAAFDPSAERLGLVTVIAPSAAATHDIATAGPDAST
jgi:predicted dehydrogenase